MKLYRGIRTESGCVVTVTDGEREYPLDPRFDLRNHSPSGFEWSFAGSGPGQLALALCADALGDDQAALRCYMTFKFRVVAALKGDEWSLGEDFVREMAEGILAEKE